MPHTPQPSPAGATIQPPAFDDGDEIGESFLSAVDNYTADSDLTAAIFKAAAPFDQTVLYAIPAEPTPKEAAPLNQPLTYIGGFSRSFQLSFDSDEDSDEEEEANVPNTRAASLAGQGIHNNREGRCY